MPIQKSELRIKKNKLRRKQQLTKHIVLTVFAICLVITLSLTMNSFFSAAHSSDNSDLMYKYYTSVIVQPGDTLWSIADEYKDAHYTSTDDYIKELMNMNHLTENKINAGDYLIVCYYSPEFMN